MPTIHHGDCIETMNAMPPESVDAIVTDPPYGLGFMGKKWDGLPPSLEWAEACYRVLKPGGHIAAFGGTRTWHRLAVAIEDAGFEMRDSLAWLYGSGFPKSMNVGKAIDKTRVEDEEPRAVVTSWVREQCESLGWNRKRLCEAFGVTNQPIQGWTETNPKYAIIPTWENWQKLKALVGFGDDMDAEVWRLNGRKGTLGDNWQNANVVGIKKGAMSGWNMDGTTKFVDREEKAPATPEAQQWDGWGTALKPAFEPIVLARKPLAEKTVARNVLAHGTGAINVDACRIGTTVETWPATRSYGGDPSEVAFTKTAGGVQRAQSTGSAPSGRWPANVLLDHHAAAWVDEQSGASVSSAGNRGLQKSGQHGGLAGEEMNLKPGTDYVRGHNDSGGASRFFYTAKAPKRERPNVDGVQHPTVKPLAIMRWLIRLVTPPGGTVLDPFAGSGTTIEAALIEGFDPVGIEMETDYLPLIQHRIDRQAGTLTA